MSEPAEKALKFDNGKVDLSIIPRKAKEGIAKAFMYGEKKYGRYNFKKKPGLKWSQLISGVDRHMTAFNSGEDMDPESTLNHLYHAAAGVCMLIEYYEHQIGEDNREKPDVNSQK